MALLLTGARLDLFAAVGGVAFPRIAGGSGMRSCLLRLCTIALRIPPACPISPHAFSYLLALFATHRLATAPAQSPRWSACRCFSAVSAVYCLQRRDHLIKVLLLLTEIFDGLGQFHKKAYSSSSTGAGCKLPLYRQASFSFLLQAAFPPSKLFCRCAN